MDLSSYPVSSNSTGTHVSQTVKLITVSNERTQGTECVLKGVVASWKLPQIPNNRQLASPQIHLFNVARFVEKNLLTTVLTGYQTNPVQFQIPNSTINRTTRLSFLMHSVNLFPEVLE